MHVKGSALLLLVVKGVLGVVGGQEIGCEKWEEVKQKSDEFSGCGW